MTRTVALNSIYELAKQDERVVFIGTDLAPNTLADFKRDFPERYFMCGVQEQSTMGMAAGLALEGFIPYVNNIASFLTRRCYEQIVIDVCAHNLPVRLLGNGGGAVYQPLGLTHIGQDDLAIMRAIPNMAVICCSDNEEMKSFMPTTLDYSGPMYIRLGKDTDPIYKQQIAFVEKPADILLLSTGIMSVKCQETAKILLANNIVAQAYHSYYIKPFPYGIQDISEFKLIVTAEEGILTGGLGSAVLEYLADNNIQIPVLRLGFPDAFPHHYGEQADLLETYGLTPTKMAERIKGFYGNL